MSFLLDFTLGGLSAAQSKLAAAPFNRAKQLLQLQNELVRQGRLERPFTGLWDAFARCVRVEGPLSLWRGALCDVLLYYPTQALNFALKDSIKSLFNFDRNHSYGLWFLGSLVSGAMAGAASLMLTYPLHLAHTLLTTDVLAPELGRTSYQFSGVIDTWAKTVEHSGPLGLYNGFGVSVAGVVLYRGCYFGLYDSFKPLVIKDPKNFLASFLFGWGVTIVAGLLTYPLDTIRRRMMVAGATPMAFDGTLDCVATIWREDGLSGFFHGATANIARAIIGAMALVLWDQVQEAIKRPSKPNNNAN